MKIKLLAAALAVQGVCEQARAQEDTSLNTAFKQICIDRNHQAPLIGWKEISAHKARSIELAREAIPSKQVKIVKVFLHRGGSNLVKIESDGIGKDVYYCSAKSNEPNADVNSFEQELIRLAKRNSLPQKTNRTGKRYGNRWVEWAQPNWRVNISEGKADRVRQGVVGIRLLDFPEKAPAVETLYATIFWYGEPVEN